MVIDGNGKMAGGMVSGLSFCRLAAVHVPFFFLMPSNQCRSAWAGFVCRMMRRVSNLLGAEDTESLKIEPFLEESTIPLRSSHWSNHADNQHPDPSDFDIKLPTPWARIHQAFFPSSRKRNPMSCAEMANEVYDSRCAQRSRKHGGICMVLKLHALIGLESQKCA